jgi:hypothetical protein
MSEFKKYNSSEVSLCLEEFGSEYIMLLAGLAATSQVAFFFPILLRGGLFFLSMQSAFAKISYLVVSQQLAS